MSGLQNLVKWLNAFADAIKSAENISDFHKAKPLVALYFPNGSPCDDPSVAFCSTQISDMIVNAHRLGAFDANCFADLRGALDALNGPPYLPLVCLAKFLLRTSGIHLSGPVQDDIRVISRALKTAEKERISDAARGRRVKVAGKVGHIAIHGSKTEKQQRWDLSHPHFPMLISESFMIAAIAWGGVALIFSSIIIPMV